MAEGLPAEPKRPFMRDSKQDADGVRRWRGPREISSDLIDVLGYDERVLTATEKLMQAPTLLWVGTQLKSSTSYERRS